MIFNFILAVNSSAQQQTPTEPPPVSDGFYISAAGTGNGSQSNPMSWTDFLSETLEDGDKIYFNRGDTFEIGELDTTELNLEFRAFGTGADPVIQGSEDISGLTWTSEGSGVYSTPMVSEPHWIWINGQCAKMAETPRIPIVSRGSTTSITIAHAAVSGYSSIVGAYLNAKDKEFSNSQLVEITAYNGAGVITIDDAIDTGSNVDIVILNKQDFFSGDNEWVWESGTLYVKAASNPSGMDIRVSAFDYAFKVEGSATFRDLEIKEYFQFGVWSENGVIDVEDCDIHDIRDSGVIIRKAVTGANVSFNIISRCGNNGITTRPCTNSTFNNNLISDSGMQANYGWQTWTSGDGSLSVNDEQVNGCGIVQMLDLDASTVTGSGNSYEGNTITNSAYNGISLNIGTQNTIRHNTIDNFMNRFNDGGGIYTFYFRNANLPNEDNEISYNYIKNSNGKTYSAGVYCDNRTLAAFVHHNTIEQCTWGTLINADTRDCIVEDNNYYNCTYGVVYSQGVIVTNLYDDNINNQCYRNTFGLLKNQKAFWFDTRASFPSWNPFTGGGCDNNYFIKNASPAAGDIADSDNKGNDLNLGELRTAYGQDANSVYRSYNPVLVVNNTSEISDEDGTDYFKDLDGNALTTYTIPAYYSRIIAEHNNSNQLVSSSGQYFSAGTTADIQFTHTSVFTVAIRFKVAANPSAVICLIDNRTSAGRGWTVQMTTGGVMQIQLVNTVSTNRYQFIHNVDVADNAWHQIVFVKAATVTSSRAFLDGSEITNTSGPASNLSATIASTDALTIGRNNTSAGTMDGFIDDVAIWNSDRSGDMVSIYNGGREIDLRSVGITAPLHYWRMGQADHLLDLGTSASKLNLTAVNSPTASTDAT